MSVAARFNDVLVFDAVVTVVVVVVAVVAIVVVDESTQTDGDELLTVSFIYNDEIPDGEDSDDDDALQIPIEAVF